MNLILDENIIEFAVNVQDAYGNLDPTCIRLLVDILKRCDSIYCSTELYKKYQNKLKRFREKATFVAKLMKLIQNKGSLKFNENPSKLKLEQGIPPDDIYLLRLAVQTESILVSADERLKTSLEHHGIIKRYSIRIRLPAEIYS